MKKKLYDYEKLNRIRSEILRVIGNIFFCFSFVIAIALIFFSSVTSECIVVGSSMVPTYNCDEKAGNDIVFVNKRNNNYKYGDVVVVNLEKTDPIIKRVIGVPGDIIDIVFVDNEGYKLEINGKIIEEDYILIKDNVDTIEKNGMKKYYINFIGDMKLTYPYLFNEEGKLVVPENEYFVLGDNRHESKDSMYYGTFDKSEIIGIVEHSLYSNESKFVFYWDYIVEGKFFRTIANSF